MTFVRLVSAEGFDAAEKAFLADALEALRCIVNSAPFLGNVQRAVFEPPAYRSGSGQRSPAQVAAIIAHGWELDEGAFGDNVIELKVRKVTTLGPAMRGTVPIGSDIIHISHTYFTTWSGSGQSHQLAALLLHEWMHVAGFDHTYNDRERDWYDVAYQVERLARAAYPTCTDKTLTLEVDLAVESLAPDDQWSCRRIALSEV